MHFRSLRHVFVTIWIDEGPKALLRGYWATILGKIRIFLEQKLYFYIL